MALEIKRHIFGVIRLEKLILNKIINYLIFLITRILQIIITSYDFTMIF